ncbi:MAG: glycosyltransferase [Clostridia bacterium]
MKILILVNHYNTLRIFRKELLLALHQQGHDLVVSMPPCDEENLNLIRSYGCRVILTKEMERRSVNPITDVFLLKRYLRILKDEQPDKVITYTIKPNIYGAMACKIRRIPHFVNVTGLGSAYQAQGGLMRRLVSFLYRISLNKADRIFFENVGNRDTLVQEKIVKKAQTIVMPGAGVNLDEFTATLYPDAQDGIRYLFVGRIMKEKGVDELFTAIKRLKAIYQETSFDFIGWYEDDYKATVEALERDGVIRFHGFQLEVRPFIAQAHCVILPSWHEGMSNTLLESAAMCRPVITNAIHGCMEAVLDGRTGYLTKLQDADDLFLKMKQFVELPQEKRRQMGVAGRAHMAQVFDKKLVVARTIEALRVKRGSLVISLDFELFWGMHDIDGILQSYAKNFEGVRVAIPKMLAAFRQHNIHVTWAMVGFLMAQSKAEILGNMPEEALWPQYANLAMSSYRWLDTIPETEREGPYYYAKSLLAQIQSVPEQVIASHTFSHYYCNEAGQTVASFDADLKAANRIASQNGLTLKALVLPRNQHRIDYEVAIKANGFVVFRGEEENWIYRIKNDFLKKSLRFLDTYLPLSGHNCYDIEAGDLTNLRGSRFLRPYVQKMSFLEPLKLLRVKRQMKHAAKHRQVFHLWWHPHNFGANTDKNMANLEHILRYFEKMRQKYQMQSCHMEEVLERQGSQE